MIVVPGVAEVASSFVDDGNVTLFCTVQLLLSTQQVSFHLVRSIQYCMLVMQSNSNLNCSFVTVIIHHRDVQDIKFFTLLFAFLLSARDARLTLLTRRIAAAVLQAAASDRTCERSSLTAACDSRLARAQNCTGFQGWI